MIDYNDYIRHKRPNGTIVLKYHMYCDNCGESRGYQTKDHDSVKLCHSCSSKNKKLSKETRQKISAGVQKYYDEIHNHKEIQTEVPKQKRNYSRRIEPTWKRCRRELPSRDKKYPEGTRYDFTDEEIQDFLQQPCVYCGDTENIGLERIDNDLGHCKANCLPCCTLCNLTRGSRYTVEEFKLIGEVIKVIKNNRKTIQND